MKLLLKTLIVVLLMSGCVHYTGQPKLSKVATYALVNDLPDNSEKAVSLAILNNPTTKYRVDHHGFPTWRWRGADDIGGCVHIDPVSLKPYLETQFPKKLRTSTPKYIDFGTDGTDWQCRVHRFVLGVETEKNWSSPECHSEGKALLKLLQQHLNLSNGT